MRRPNLEFIKQSATLPRRRSEWLRQSLQEVIPYAEQLEQVLSAAEKLFNAPHHEHFDVRLNDEELAALRSLQAAVQIAIAERRPTDAPIPEAV